MGHIHDREGLATLTMVDDDDDDGRRHLDVLVIPSWLSAFSGASLIDRAVSQPTSQSVKSVNQSINWR